MNLMVVPNLIDIMRASNRLNPMTAFYGTLKTITDGPCSLCDLRNPGIGHFLETILDGPVNVRELEMTSAICVCHTLRPITDGSRQPVLPYLQTLHLPLHVMVSKEGRRWGCKGRAKVTSGCVVKSRTSEYCTSQNKKYLRMCCPSL